MYTICVKFMEIGSLVLVKREKRSSERERRSEAKKPLSFTVGKMNLYFPVHSRKLRCCCCCLSLLFFENSNSPLNHSLLDTLDIRLNSRLERARRRRENRQQSAIGIAKRLAGNRTGGFCVEISQFLLFARESTRSDSKRSTPEESAGMLQRKKRGDEHEQTLSLPRHPYVYRTFHINFLQ